MDALDRTDRRLLVLLQKNNRRRLRDLADELEISTPTCLRRLRRLGDRRYPGPRAALLTRLCGIGRHGLRRDLARCERFG